MAVDNHSTERGAAETQRHCGWRPQTKRRPVDVTEGVKDFNLRHVQVPADVCALDASIMDLIEREERKGIGLLPVQDVEAERDLLFSQSDSFSLHLYLKKVQSESWFSDTSSSSSSTKHPNVSIESRLLQVKSSTINHQNPPQSSGDMNRSLLREQPHLLWDPELTVREQRAQID
ncbi:uncharacterized protein V6R79_004459 [Siganus canaliculatus]